MKQLPAPIRDNAVLITSLAAAVTVNVLLLWGFQGSMRRQQVVLVVPAAMPGATDAPIPPDAKKADKTDKPAAAKPPPEKPASKQDKKPEPKRATIEKKPESAKPPTKENPGNADLAPLKMEVPEPLSVDMAQLIRIQVENRGTSPAGAHHDALYFSLTDKLDDKAVSLGLIEAGGTLAPGAKQWERAQILLPDKTPTGRAYLIVVLNADGAMPETNHANNQLVVPVMVDANSVPLGDPNERPRTTVAWISSKDFRELKARQSSTLQPSIQNETQEQKDAKLNNQPGLDQPKPILGEVKPKPAEKTAEKTAEQTPKIAPVAQHKEGGEKPKDKPEPPKPPKPAAVAKADEKPSPTKPKPASTAPGKGAPTPPKKVAETQPETPVAKSQDLKPIETQAKPADPTPTPPVTTATAKPAPHTPGAKDAAPKPQEPQKTAAASSGEGATATPLDTSSAPATQLDESSLEQQPGRVLVGKGVKINTARIQPPSPAALIEGVSANPRVAVTFNAEGEVIKAEIIRSSGNSGWDHQVQIAMQRWTAEGEEVKKGNLVIRWTVLLGGAD